MIFLLLRGKNRDFILQRLLLCKLTCLLCIIMLDYSHAEGREWWCSVQTHTRAEGMRLQSTDSRIMLFGRTVNMQQQNS